MCLQSPNAMHVAVHCGFNSYVLICHHNKRAAQEQRRLNSLRTNSRFPQKQTSRGKNLFVHDGAEQGLKKGAGERERGEGALSSQKMFEQAGLLWRERSSSLAWRGKETTGWMDGGSWKYSAHFRSKERALAAAVSREQSSAPDVDDGRRFVPSPERSWVRYEPNANIFGWLS